MTKSEYEDKVSEARAEIVDAQDNLFKFYVESYLSENLRERYNEIENADEREDFLNDLEKIVVGISESSSQGFRKISNRIFTHSQNIQNKFDGKKARDIRDGGGMKVIELARMLSKNLGCTDERVIESVRSAISSYETGKLRPPLKGIKYAGRKAEIPYQEEYLQWLKEHGYNPYDLPDEGRKIK